MRKRDTIYGISDSQGNWLTDEKEIEETFIDYFKNIFSSFYPSPEDILKVNDKVKCCEDSEMNVRLTAKFTREEIEAFISQMHPTKAPGPDGFLALFFQKYWAIIGDQTTDLCLNFLNNRISYDNWNHTNIVLVPKVHKPSKVTDFSPISL